MRFIFKCPVCGEEVEFFDSCETYGWKNCSPLESNNGRKGASSDYIKLTTKDKVSCLKKYS